MSNDNQELDPNMDPGSTLTAMTSGPFSRRRLLAGAGIISAGLIAAACGSDSKKTTATTGAPSTTVATSTAPTTGATTAPTTAATTPATGGSTPSSEAPANNDGAILMLAAGLEVLAVGTYKAALDAATAGKLGAVPPAVATFVTTAMAQHQAALDKLNSVLTAAGATAVTEPNAKLKPVVDAAFGKVTDVGGAAKLALMLEQIAAATYQSAIPAITDKTGQQLAGSIMIIDFQHAAVLNFVLGNYPVPDTFGKLDQAVAA